DSRSKEDTRFAFESDGTAASEERLRAFFPRGEGQSEVAAGSGRSCENTIAFPTCTLIETALAGGTVAREIIRAGLSEHRTRTSHIDLEFTKGWVWGAAGPVDLPAVSQDRHPGRKERLRANP